MYKITILDILLICGLVGMGLIILILGYYAYHYFCRTEEAETLNIELMNRVQELKDYIRDNGLI